MTRDLCWIRLLRTVCFGINLRLNVSKCFVGNQGMLCKPLPFAVDARTRPGIVGWLRIRRSFGGCLCVCVEVCFRLSLSLSPYLPLSFQRSIAKPGTASSASTSSSSGCTRRCYFYPSRDASVSAICPRFFVFRCFPFSPSVWLKSVWLRRRPWVASAAVGLAPARTRPISPEARSDWGPLPLGKRVGLLQLFYPCPP